jgi:hypothetical protein
MVASGDDRSLTPGFDEISEQVTSMLMLLGNGRGLTDRLLPNRR